MTLRRATLVEGARPRYERFLSLFRHEARYRPASIAENFSQAALSVDRFSSWATSKLDIAERLLDAAPVPKVCRRADRPKAWDRPKACFGACGVDECCGLLEPNHCSG